MLHSATWPGFKAMKKGEMAEALRKQEVPFNPLVEALVCIQRGQNNYLYMKADLQCLYEFVRKGEPQFWHEWLHGPVKMYFDLDFSNRANTVEEAMLVAEAFLRVLFDRLYKGVSMTPHNRAFAFEQFFSEFMIMRRMRVPGALKGDKLSLHLVRNNMTHYSNAAALGSYLSTILLPADMKEFCMDMSVYKDGNFQTVGGVKWDEWGGVQNPNRDHYMDHFMPTFFPIGYKLEEFDFRIFCECLAQFIPAGSKLCGPAVAKVVASEEYRGPSKDLVAKAVQLVQESFEENSEAKIAGVLYVDEARARLTLSGVHRCLHGAQNYTSAILEVSFQDEASALRCTCGTASKITFLTNHSKMAFDFLNESLPSIMERSLDRVDFPITYDELGGRALLPSFYEKFGFSDFKYHPPPHGTGPLYSLLIWRWIFGRSRLSGLCSEVMDMRLAVAYINLFFNFVQKREQFVCRALCSYFYVKDAQLKRVDFSKFLYLVEEEYGREDKHGNRKIKEVEKKFYDYWMKDPKQRIFSDSKVGAYEFFAEAAFHDNPPAATNFTDCLAQWKSLGEDVAVKQMVRRLWDDYLNIVTLLEEPAVKQMAKAWIERWFLSILFNYGEKLFTSLWLVSPEQGTGKSTMPELCCKALGSSLTLTVKNMKAFINSRFNTEGNRGLVFFDDANTSELTEADAGALKALVTNQIHNSAIKSGCENYQTGNQQNFFIAINPSTGTYIPDAATKTERRNCAMEVPDSKSQEEYFRMNPYRCAACREADLLIDGHCRHEYNSFANFWCLWKQHVMGVSFTQKGDLFFLFFGMLFELYLEKKPTWTRSLQTTLPICKAITTHQKVARPPAFEFLDMSCKRGYHVCPYGGAQDIFKGKAVDWPEDIPLLGETATWLTRVPVSTLYRGFKIEFESKMLEKGFLVQLNHALVERNGVGFTEEMVNCISYEYRAVAKDVLLASADKGKVVVDKAQTKKVWEHHWVAVSRQPKLVKCLILPRPRDEAARGLFMLRQPTNITTSFQLDIASLSQAPVDLRSSSNGSGASFQPEESSDLPSQDPRVNTRALLARADDAIDVDFYSERLRRNDPEPEPDPDSDIEQDEESPESNPFLDQEAEECDDEPESPQKRQKVDEEDEVLILSLDSD